MDVKDATEGCFFKIYFHIEEAEEKQHIRCVGQDDCASICWWRRASGEYVNPALTPVTARRDQTHKHPTHRLTLAKRLLMLTGGASNPAAATSNNRSISSCWANLPGSEVMAPVTWPETMTSPRRAADSVTNIWIMWKRLRVTVMNKHFLTFL